MIPQARQKENSFSYAKVQDSLVKALSIDGALGVALGGLENRDVPGIQGYQQPCLSRS
jgi:hypothetical protein